MKNIIISAIILLIPITANAEHLLLDEVSQSVCKITLNSRDVFGRTVKSYGTGVVVSEDDTKYYILTNGHVIRDQKSTLVEFFYNGYKSASTQANVVWSRFQSGTTIDAALLSVDKNVFGKLHPKVIPIADKHISLSEGAYIYSAGCPNGRWSQAWEGRVIRTSENITYINAPPVEGQSGSAILSNIKDDQGNINTRVVGLLTWRMGQQIEYGGCVSLSRLHEIMTGVPKRDVITTSHIYLTPIQYEQVEICDSCKKPFSEHLVFPNGSGGFLRDSQGEIRISCPKDKFLTSGIRTKEIVGNCTNCPPGGCPLLPWNGGIPHERNTVPNEPAPIAPNGIWNIPDSQQQPSLPERLSEETKKKLQDLESYQQLIDSLKAEQESLKNKTGSLESEKNSLMQTLSNKEGEITGYKNKLEQYLSNINNVQTQLDNKERLIADYVNKVSTFKEKEEVLLAENQKLAAEDTYQNVSFTAAGVAGTAGLWFLKSYGLPFALGLLKRRTKGQKVPQQNDKMGYNNSAPPVNYGTLPDVVVNNPRDNSMDVSVEDKIPRQYAPPQDVPPGKYAGEIRQDQQQLPAWNNYAHYPNAPHPVQYQQNMTGYNPGAPFGVPPKKASGELIRGILSEIVNEYGHDTTITPGHIEQLLNQRLESRYGIK